MIGAFDAIQIASGMYGTKTKTKGFLIIASTVASVLADCIF